MKLPLAPVIDTLVPKIPESQWQVSLDYALHVDGMGFTEVGWHRSTVAAVHTSGTMVHVADIDDRTLPGNHELFRLLEPSPIALAFTRPTHPAVTLLLFHPPSQGCSNQFRNVLLTHSGFLDSFVPPKPNFPIWNPFGYLSGPIFRMFGFQFSNRNFALLPPTSYIPMMSSLARIYLLPMLSYAIPLVTQWN